MSNVSRPTLKRGPAWASTLPEEIQTPCFVVYERGIIENLHATARACKGGVARLMPHVKTHRAAWIVKLLLAEGVQAFKAATVTEVQMVLAAGAKKVVWAYPTVNKAHIKILLAAAEAHPAASVGALIDSPTGVSVWREMLAVSRPDNLKLIVDLDPGMGRTGAPLTPASLALARDLHTLGCFGGWHVYDGHIQNREAAARHERIAEVAQRVAALMRAAADEGLSTDLIAGASYSFDAWPEGLANYVAPGSWVYSSSQHDADLPDLGWKPSAYVLATVISKKETTVTLDAGAKAISPDKPLAERFRWDGKILMMSEEHVVVENTDLNVGDRVLLMPKHACTAAYLYDKAMVFGKEGGWEYREQLGSSR
jgi:3-hydroxy-D-aspartate aldolase